MASDIYNPNFAVHVLDPKLLIPNVLGRKNSGSDLRLYSDIPELINPSEYSHPKDFPGRGHQYAIDNEWYFFARLLRARKMGNGKWKFHRRENDIWDENQIIGCMRTFTFIKRGKRDESPSWILKEFSDLCTSSSSGADPWVLWVIYRRWSKCSTLLSVKSPPINRGTSGPTQEVGPCVFQNENMYNASHLHQIQPNSMLPTRFPSLHEQQQHWSTNQYCNMNASLPLLPCCSSLPNINQLQTQSCASNVQHNQFTAECIVISPTGSTDSLLDFWMNQEMLDNDDNEVRGSSVSQNQSMSSASHPHQSSSPLLNMNEFQTQYYDIDLEHNQVPEEVLGIDNFLFQFHDHFRYLNEPDGEEMQLHPLWDR